jgi:hypothetical protein
MKTVACGIYQSILSLEYVMLSMYAWALQIFCILDGVYRRCVCSRVRVHTAVGTIRATPAASLTTSRTFPTEICRDADVSKR